MIRQALHADVPALKALLKSEPGLWQSSWREDVVERSLAASAGLAFVWEEAGRILGFACAHDLGFRGYLSELVVAESARARGIGRQLVQRIEQELLARGCTPLIADAWKEAEGFYRRLGWSGPEAVLLRKRLEGAQAGSCGTGG